MRYGETDFQIGDVRIRPNRLEVHRNGAAIPVEPKVMALLAALAARRGETVSRETLMAEVWPEVHVSEDALHRCIWKARRALGDSGANPRILGTVSRKGYRLLLPVSDGMTAEPIHVPSARLNRFAAAAALAFGLTLALMFALAWPFGAAPVAPPPAVPLTALPGYETRPAFSPDGRDVVFQHFRRTGPLKGQSDLMLAPVAAGGLATDLTKTAENEVSPDWAHRSNRIAFRRVSESGCRLIVLDLATRAESEIGTCDAGTWSALVWSPDDKAVLHNGYGPNRRTTRILATRLDNGGTSSITTPPDDFFGDRDPALSPDGRRLAFLRTRVEGLDDVYVRGLFEGVERRITFDAQRVAGLTWTADGRRLVYASERFGVFRLWSVGLDGGRPQPVNTIGMNATTPVYSSAGELVYEEWKSEINIRRLTMGAEDFAAAPVVESSRWDWEPRWSPDGQQLAFLTNRSGPTELWVAAAGKTPRRLAALSQPAGTSLRWSPDGRSLAFAAPVGEQFDIHLLRVSDDTVTVLREVDSDERAPAWSVDGRWLYFGSNRDGRWQIWKAPAEGGAAERVTEHGGLAALESSDGRWLYYVKGDEPGLWRRKTAGDSGADELVTAAVRPGVLAWDLSGGAAYYARPGAPGAAAALMRVSIDGGQEDRVAWLEPPAGGYPEWHGASGLSVSTDGRTVTVATIDRSDSDLWLVPGTASAAALSRR